MLVQGQRCCYGYEGLTPIIQACGALFEVADKVDYHRYKSLYGTMANNSALC
jgi:hypothetical protein